MFFFVFENLDQEHLAPIIHLVAEGKWLASRDAFNRIFIISLESNQVHMQLPVYEKVVTGLNLSRKHVGVVLSNNEFILWDLAKKARDNDEQNDNTRKKKKNKSVISTELKPKDKIIDAVPFPIAKRSSEWLLYSNTATYHIDASVRILSSFVIIQ